MTQNQYESLKKSFYSILEKEIIVNHRRVNINDESNFVLLSRKIISRLE